MIDVIYHVSMALTTFLLAFCFIFKEIKLKMKFTPTILKTTIISTPTVACKMETFTSTSYTENY